METSGNETNTESWRQLLKPTTHKDLLTLSAKANQPATDNPEERTHRLLEDIERGIQKRLDEWCAQRTQDTRRTRKNVLRALRKGMEKQIPIGTIILIAGIVISAETWGG